MTATVMLSSPPRARATSVSARATVSRRRAVGQRSPTSSAELGDRRHVVPQAVGAQQQPTRPIGRQRARRVAGARASGPTQCVIAWRTGLAAACSGVSMPRGDLLLGPASRRSSAGACSFASIQYARLSPTHRSPPRRPGAAPTRSCTTGRRGRRGSSTPRTRGTAPAAPGSRRSSPPWRRARARATRGCEHRAAQLWPHARAAASPALAVEMPSHTTTATPPSPTTSSVERVLVAPVDRAAIAHRRRDRRDRARLDPGLARAARCVRRSARRTARRTGRSA